MEKFLLKNSDLKITFYDIGGAIDEIIYDSENMILSYKNKDNYQKNTGIYLNALIGPSAGRIAKGHLEQYQLSINNGINHLHGGNEGISLKKFNVEKINNKTAVLSLITDHSKDGYPKGNFKYTIKYEIKNNQFIIDMLCYPPIDLPMNMTSHLYFNLNKNKDIITNHKISNNYSHRINIDENMIPNKVIQNEFKGMNNIQDILNTNNQQIKDANGIDFPFILQEKNFILENEIYSVNIQTSANCIVLYSGNYIDDKIYYNNHIKGKKYLGIALEPQFIPNYCNLLSNYPCFNQQKPFHQIIKYTFNKKD